MTRQRLVDVPVIAYAKNYKALDDYRSDNRQHQNECLSAAETANYGQIISPCGTGKTRMQVCRLISQGIASTQAHEGGVIAIASHRLGLNRQLLSKAVDLAIKCGLPFDLLAIGSDRPDLNALYSIPEYMKLGYSPLNSSHLFSSHKDEVRAFANRAREDRRLLIISSTYHSFELLLEVGNINEVAFDEAHNITERRFFDAIELVKPIIKRGYFYTATRKVAGDDGGMNNFAFFGKGGAISTLPR